jgi:predicted dehydrogenase
MINAAIVGLGRWGQRLVDSVHGTSEAIRFVAGATRTVARADAYARERGFPLYDTYDQVLADPRVEAVVLATPHTQHAEQVIAAARAGKHVFTEKPFALTATSANAAVRACARAGVTLAVGFNWRFQPALQTLKRMLEEGTLGTLLHLEGNFCGPSIYRFPPTHWRQAREEGPGGGMTGRGVHVVDAFLYLAGRVESVYAQSVRRVLDAGLDDTTSMLFRFRGGATAYLGTVIATAETWRMQVFGSKGWVELGDVEHLHTWPMKICRFDPSDLHVHPRPDVQTFPSVSTERAELEHFAAAALARRPLATADGDEVHGVAVFEAILQSAALGRSVNPSPATGPAS